MLDSLVGAPAYVGGARGDILATNKPGEAFFTNLFADPERPVDIARFVFFNATAHVFFADWDKVADDVIGVLRAEASRDPHDVRPTELIGELSTRSEEYRVRWAAHHVRLQPKRNQALPPPDRGVISHSTSSPSISLATLAKSLWSTPPSPHPLHRKLSTSSAAGPPPLRATRRRRARAPLRQRSGRRELHH